MKSIFKVDIWNLLPCKEIYEMLFKRYEFVCLLFFLIGIMKFRFSEKKFGRAATLADNESLRITLAALYHMVELIRNRHIAGKIQVEQSDVQHLQEQFLLELGNFLCS